MGVRACVLVCLRAGAELIKKVPTHLVRTLQYDLEVEGGMSNDYHVFPWRSDGALPGL